MSERDYPPIPTWSKSSRRFRPVLRRSRDRTPAGVLADWAGTCSTKHALLAELIGERCPDLNPRLVHRVYCAGRAMVRERFGKVPAATVPDSGLIDVHCVIILIRCSRD